MEGRPLEDAELVERARRGDTHAYEELVRMYQQLAVRTAYVITANGADAQDAAQEAFVKAYYGLARFREGASFRPWLLRIVANEAINRRRAGRRREALALRAAGQSPAADRDGLVAGRRGGVAEGRPSGDAAPSPESAALA